jgi:sulfite reductase (ferredoxin)
MTEAVIEIGGQQDEDEPSWARALADEMPEHLAREIDMFELQIKLRKQGKVEEKLFAETRLRRGVYGQRYDNGQRHDGVATRKLPYDEKPTKGPNTRWDAPGMQRIKIPYGGMTAHQLDVLSALAEEYSDGICHVTTRQDIQLHFVHIEQTPDLMRRLAASGITTREACGNTVRNVTGCPIAGVCPTEAFDITPYAHAMTYFLLGHKDTQDFGRKFKVCFSGCSEEACGLASMHDIGLIAKKKVGEDGVERRGFDFYVGGGLGSVPYQSQLLEEFVSEQEILPLSQAVCRIFARMGEKANRTRARLKFLVAKLGMDEFRRLVREERKVLPFDDRWAGYLADIDHRRDAPLKAGAPLIQLNKMLPDKFRQWRSTNVKAQKQSGYAVVTVTLPLGDFTSDQGRALADIARRFTGDNMRTTVEQNIVFRWVSEADVPELWRALEGIGLGDPGAETIVDVTACPGTDTCKLGIASSRGLAAELRLRLAAKFNELDVAVQGMRIKVSGCFNSCAQHHVADLGFLGVSRKKGTHMVPHFQVVLGGQWTKNAAAYGLAIGAVPSRNIPATVDRILDYFLENRLGSETFQAFCQRMGRAAMRDLLADLIEMPAYETNPEYYRDWGDAREYSMTDYGEGECAGELVPLTEFGLQTSETEAFEAQIDFDRGAYGDAGRKAYKSMLTAAKALIQGQFIDITDNPDQIVSEFEKRFCETKLFWDPYAAGKFAAFLLMAHKSPNAELDASACKHRLEEAVLFIEAAHACYDRMTRMKVAPAANV